jgi:hypothetical protein
MTSRQTGMVKRAACRQESGPAFLKAKEAALIEPKDYFQ